MISCISSSASASLLLLPLTKHNPCPSRIRPSTARPPAETPWPDNAIMHRRLLSVLCSNWTDGRHLDTAVELIRALIPPVCLFTGLRRLLAWAQRRGSQHIAHHCYAAAGCLVQLQLRRLYLRYYQSCKDLPANHHSIPSNEGSATTTIAPHLPRFVLGTRMLSLTPATSSALPLVQQPLPAIAKTTLLSTVVSTDVDYGYLHGRYADSRVLMAWRSSVQHPTRARAAAKPRPEASCPSRRVSREAINISPNCLRWTLQGQR